MIVLTHAGALLLNVTMPVKPLMLLTFILKLASFGLTSVVREEASGFIWKSGLVRIFTATNAPATVDATTSAATSRSQIGMGLFSFWRNFSILIIMIALEGPTIEQCVEPRAVHSPSL